MYYYKFNIGDFDKITRHLSITERGLYRDLLDLYIKNEKPIITDIKKLERLLCIKSKMEKTALANVLADFFVLTDNGYFCEYCQSILDDTTEKADVARENGKKGGRPPKQQQSQEIADVKSTESENKTNENLTITQTKPNNNPNESYPLPNNPLPNNPNTQIPPNPQEQKSGVCVGKTAEEVLAKAEQIKQANAQDIQNWVAPEIREMQDMLNGAGFDGVLTAQKYTQLTSDMKTHFAEQAILGKPIVTDSLRKNKLRDWIMRNEQKNSKPSYQKKSQPQFGGVNDPLAVNHKFRPNDTGMVAPNTIFEVDEHGNFVARPIELVQEI